MEAIIDSKDRRAFELFVEAKEDIDFYKKRKENSSLFTAQSKLEKALSIDPNFLRARYYHGIVFDLIGRPKDAVGDLEAVFNAKLSFKDEIQFNLGVAYYHQYSHKHLKKAIVHFQEVVASTKPRSALSLLAHALLSQAHAMLMIPPLFDQVDRNAIQDEYYECERQVKKVKESLRKVFRLFAPQIDDDTLREIKWTSANAHGMSLMYYSDYFGSRERRLDLSRVALQSLEEADKHDQRNWANYCDIGSAHMRIMHWSKNSSESHVHFEKALEYLTQVVDTLRPGYGFALYEIGRVYRLMGKFTDAKNYFEKSLKVSNDYRDVSDKRVNEELQLTLEESTAYPWKGTSGLS